MCFIRFGAYPNQMHRQLIVKKKTCCEKKEKKGKNRKEKHKSTE
jgi:hypothetical protein